MADQKKERFIQNNSYEMNFESGNANSNTSSFDEHIYNKSRKSKQEPGERAT